MSGFLLGYDIGSSSIKASLLDVESGLVIASAASPEIEMEISSPRSGWAEQDPDLWWHHVKVATEKIRANHSTQLKAVKAVGIAYQMHGLVIVDKNLKPLRPAIIWCDSRAVSIGEKAFSDIGKDFSLSHFLNSPGNFTASKLKWVKENEPQIFKEIYKAMLPGDYIALKLTGDASTTPSGLSEGIMWDFKNEKIAEKLLEYYGIPQEIISECVPTFDRQGTISGAVAVELGLSLNIPVSYRAGDQPNNAFSLSVLEPGDAATTAGTSGVIYGVSKERNFDPLSRVNTFLHVNHSIDAPRYGILLCINGTAILNSWLHKNLFSGLTYKEIDQLAEQAPVGAAGLKIFPYGNGAERTLNNKEVGCNMMGLNFNHHNRSHMVRAAHEGIIFSLNYGLEIMREMNCTVKNVCAGHANMFLSSMFTQTFATVCETTVSLYDTDGSQGAARGAGVGAKIYTDFKEAFKGLKVIKTVEPERDNSAYKEYYQSWRALLTFYLKSCEKHNGPISIENCL